MAQLSKLVRPTGYHEHDNELSFYNFLGEMLALPKYLHRLSNFLQTIENLNADFGITQAVKDLKAVGMLQHMVCIVLKYKYLQLDLEHNDEVNMWVRNPYITRETILEIVR